MDWIRKNQFVRDIRRLLKVFRIVEVESSIADEAEMALSEGGGPTLRRSGRVVVVLKLTGYWRGQ